MTSERAAQVWGWIAAAQDAAAPRTSALPPPGARTLAATQPSGAQPLTAQPPAALPAIVALCHAAAARLGVDGAGVSVLSGPATREPLYFSDELSGQLDELQFSTGEGPAADEFRFGSPLLIPDLAASAGRWPVFAPAAIAAGARAMFAFPLQAGAIRVGNLSLYRARAGPLATADLANVLIFADIALHLLDSSAGISVSSAYRPLGGLSLSRAEVYQATGMISVQLGVSLAEALVALRARAFADSVDVSNVATGVVSRRLKFDPDPLPAS